MGLLMGIILLVVGLIACFFGRRYYRLVLALVGFVVGYYAVSGLLSAQGDAVQVIGGIVAGVVVGFLFWSFYKMAYILFGIALGLTVAALIGRAFNLDGTVFTILTIVLAIVGGFLGTSIADLMIRLSTAFGGATQAIGGVAAIAAALNIALPLADPTHGGATTDSTAGIITIVAVIVLGVIGFLFQTRSDPKAA
ncbi:MAG: DUF4203 domain-containing protein [Anaerolineae bacterium]|nr:DUF4203 domain-containing protein [Anaerolineae bacterium]